ncbi:MAG: zinc ribbon domain-containing protein [Candidatus Eremiobacterota bacterium]
MVNVYEMPDLDMLVCCPLCMSPVNEDLILCPVCNEDMTDDGPVEMTVYQYKTENIKVCIYCGEPIMYVALKCPACNKWQSK